MALCDPRAGRCTGWSCPRPTWSCSRWRSASSPKRGGSRRGAAHPFSSGHKAGWHTGGEVEIPEVPEGIHLEFLPSGSPELQPAERLWPLTNEALANRLFEEIEELEEALVERCVHLLDQTEAIRDLTNYHWWPQAA